MPRQAGRIHEDVVEAVESSDRLIHLLDRPAVLHRDARPAVQIGRILIEPIRLHTRRSDDNAAASPPEEVLLRQDAQDHGSLAAAAYADKELGEVGSEGCACMNPMPKRS